MLFNLRLSQCDLKYWLFFLKDSKMTPVSFFRSCVYLLVLCVKLLALDKSFGEALST